MRQIEVAARNWPGWLEAVKDPRAARARVWTQVTPLLEASPFWRDRMGPRMPDLAAFPLTTHADYEAAIQRSFEHGDSELNGEPVRAWVRSSGSTGPYKVFPWTDSYRAQFDLGSAMTLPIVMASARIVRKRGAALNLGPMRPKDRSPTGIPIGYASAFTSPHDGAVYPLAVNDDADKFRRWLPMYAAAADVHSALAITCEPLLSILEQLEREPDFYLAHLRRPLPLPEGLTQPEVTPERLAHLERVLGAGGPLNANDLWPNLRLVQTWIQEPPSAYTS